jgi:hypothetical protein
MTPAQLRAQRDDLKRQLRDMRREPRERANLIGADEQRVEDQISAITAKLRNQGLE